MTTLIKKPDDFEQSLIHQMIQLLEEGEQVSRANILFGLQHADLVAMIVENGVVVTAATLKNPRDTYKQKVFKSANAEVHESLFTKELGYIVTNKAFEGKRYCQRLLGEFIPIIGHKKMFATTRKPSMGHILGKYGFEKIGEKYKEDLELFTRK